MLGRVLHAKRSLHDPFVPWPRGRTCPAPCRSAACRAALQQRTERPLDFRLPGRIVFVARATPSRLSLYLRRNSIVVQAIPLVEQRLPIPGDKREDGLELGSRDGMRKRVPAVSIANRTIKLGRGVMRWQRTTSDKQIFMVCWSSAASSLMPHRRSMAWKWHPCDSHSARSLGNTCSWSAFALNQVTEGRTDKDTEDLPGLQHTGWLLPAPHSWSRAPLLSLCPDSLHIGAVGPCSGRPARPDGGLQARRCQPAPGVPR